MDANQAQAFVSEMQAFGTKMGEMVDKMKETDLRAKTTESDMKTFHQGVTTALTEIRKGQGELSANLTVEITNIKDKMSQLELAINHHDAMMEEANNQHKLEQDNLEARLASASAAHTDQITAVGAEIRVHEDQINQVVTQVTHLGQRMDRVEATPPGISLAETHKITDVQAQAKDAADKIVVLEAAIIEMRQNHGRRNNG